MSTTTQAPPDSFPITVRIGTANDRVFNLSLGQGVTAILEILAAELACAIAQLELFREGHEGCLAGDHVVDIHYPHRHRHHVHWSGAVTVTVYYQAGSKTHDFKRNATVGEILRWAVNAFTIDPSIATELELARHGQEEELPHNEHLGHLAGREHCVDFDLVRGVIANGGAS